MKANVGNRRVTQLIAFSALMILPAMAVAQEATIAGTITDATGAVLPGVSVTAIHEATGNTFETVTDEQGLYRLPVRAGVFVTVQAPCTWTRDSVPSRA